MKDFLIGLISVPLVVLGGLILALPLGIAFGFAIGGILLIWPIAWLIDWLRPASRPH